MCSKDAWTSCSQCELCICTSTGTFSRRWYLKAILILTWHMHWCLLFAATTLLQKHCVWTVITQKLGWRPLEFFCRSNDELPQEYLLASTTYSLEAVADRVRPQFASSLVAPDSTVCLFFLYMLLISTTLSVWTISRILMPFRGMLAIWLAHWQHVCIDWVLWCCL